MKKKIEQAQRILQKLREEYEKTGPFVQWSNPLELLVGTILSAQCTDKRVNMVTKGLFATYKTPKDYANANISTLEKAVYSTGFYKNKAKALKESGKIMIEKFNGDVPQRLEDLLILRGVSRKTAFLIMSKAYGKNVGVAVDTHVFRLSKRMGLSDANSPDKVSDELGKIIDPKDYLDWNEYLITHGRAICGRTPRCEQCVVRRICPKNI
jgi:endonuclease III